MKFERIDGKMTRVEKVSNVITWSFPCPITDDAMKPYRTPSSHTMTASKDVIVKSSTLTFASGLVLLTANKIDVETGIFWSIFMQYIYPWFLDLATVYAAIRIAMAFYEEQRGGRESKNGFGAFVTYGKWLLLFHLIPFFVKLIDTVGKQMADNL